MPGEGGMDWTGPRPGQASGVARGTRRAGAGGGEAVWGDARPLLLLGCSNDGAATHWAPRRAAERAI